MPLGEKTNWQTDTTRRKDKMTNKDHMVKRLLKKNHSVKRQTDKQRPHGEKATDKQRSLGEKTNWLTD